MAELATIARPYAEALFQASASDLDGAAGWLDQLAAVAGNPQLLQFASDPKVAPEQVFDLVSGFVTGGLPAASRPLTITVRRKFWPAAGRPPVTNPDTRSNTCSGATFGSDANCSNCGLPATAASWSSQPAVPSRSLAEALNSASA